jgi:hypothetical protein
MGRTTPSDSAHPINQLVDIINTANRTGSFIIPVSPIILAKPALFLDN